jgi:hypothetical protein
MKTPRATLVLWPGTTTEWELTADGGEVGTGKWDAIDVGAGLDQVIRAVHRSGRQCRVVVEPCRDTSLSATTAVASVRRVLDIYEAVEVRWR